jgi:hypothetical protein
MRRGGERIAAENGQLRRDVDATILHVARCGAAWEARPSGGGPSSAGTAIFNGARQFDPACGNLPGLAR